jgi:hypothetical protein
MRCCPWNVDNFTVAKVRALNVRNAQHLIGEKKVRPGLRVVSKSRFVPIHSMADLLNRLFDLPTEGVTYGGV